MYEYDAATQALADTVLELLRELVALDPAPLNGTIQPSELAALVRPMINPTGNDPDEVIDLFVNVLMPAVIRADSPRFLAWIPSAPTKASMLFDAVVSLASISGVSWIESAGAVWAENEALRFLSDLAGMPASAGGTFVQGGSAANLSALAVARETGRRRLGDPRARVRFAVTDDTHSSVRNTMRLLDVDPLVVPLVDDHFTGAALRATLETCADPESVCAIVANAGSTNAGLVDDLQGIAEICDERNLWMHVDAAYGGAALLAPSVRGLFAGIERSDSLVVDPHKWLYAPLDCAALLYRDPELARSVHGQHAAYLDSVNDETSGWNPGDYAYQLTRRARGLPFWFSLAVYGTDAYREAVEQRHHHHAHRDRSDPCPPPPRAGASSRSCRSCCFAERVGRTRSITSGRRACRASRSRSLCRADGTTRPLPAWRFCIPTPRSTSSTRSSPPPPDR